MLLDIGSIFTFNAIRDTVEVSHLLIYECFFSDLSLIGDDALNRKCGLIMIWKI